MLDLGCGTGLIAEALSGRFQSMVGIDISGEMIQRAQEKALYTKLQVSELQQALSDSTEVFDVIIAADVLSYLGGLNEVMPLVYQRLAPGGRFIFSVETHSGTGFTLQESGRFAHSEAYISEQKDMAGFILEHSAETVLRREAGIDVPGVLYALMAPPR